jgi:hypothetical protein
LLARTLFPRFDLALAFALDFDEAVERALVLPAVSIGRFNPIEAIMRNVRTRETGLRPVSRLNITNYHPA